MSERPTPETDAMLDEVAPYEPPADALDTTEPTQHDPVEVKRCVKCGVEAKWSSADCPICFGTLIEMTNEQQHNNHMTEEQIKSNLCYHDRENPNNNLDAYDEEDRPRSRNGCGCDNCYYERDKLAMQILETQRERDEARQQLTAERALADRLAKAVQNHFDVDGDMWATQAQLDNTSNRLESALAAWKEARSEWEKTI